MKFTPFAVEQWMNEFETKCRFNLAETCVDSLTIAELLDIAGVTSLTARDFSPSQPSTDRRQRAREWQAVEPVMPKAITKAVGDPRYYDIRAENGQIVLTPVRIQRADAVRAKLAELEISEQDMEDAVTWARSAGSQR